MELHTDRLLLRPYSIADLAALREIDGDPEVSRYRSRKVITEAMTRSFIREYEQLAQSDQPSAYGFVIVLRDTNRLIGQCGITREGERKAAIWYSLNHAYWRQGYMSEAARALLRFGFEQLHLERIVASCDPANVASYRVMEKIGMTRYTPSLAAGDFEALLMRVNYGVNRDEWTP